MNLIINGIEVVFTSERQASIILSSGFKFTPSELDLMNIDLALEEAWEMNLNIDRSLVIEQIVLPEGERVLFTFVNTPPVSIVELSREYLELFL